MEFIAHGNFKLATKHNYIVNRPTGEFNREGIELMFASILNLAQEKELKDWILIESLDKESFLTPDAVTSLKSGFQLVKEQGCKMVLATHYNWMQEEILEQVKLELDLHVEFFSSEEEAIARCPIDIE